MKILGEYVVELLDVLERIITGDLVPKYVEFLANNPHFWMRTQSRMVSYWDVYYRNDFPNLRDYIGFNLVNNLNQARRELVSLRNKAP